MAANGSIWTIMIDLITLTDFRSSTCNLYSTFCSHSDNRVCVFFFMFQVFRLLHTQRTPLAEVFLVTLVSDSRIQQVITTHRSLCFLFPHCLTITTIITTPILSICMPCLCEHTNNYYTAAITIIIIIIILLILLRLSYYYNYYY